MSGIFALLTLLAVSGQPQSCDARLVHLSDPDRLTYAAAVQKAAGHATSPSAIQAVLRDGAWSAVWALPADREPGVFVFRQPAQGGRLHFESLWGGALGPDGPGVVTAWMRKNVHMPLPLARCVGERVYKEGP